MTVIASFFTTKSRRAYLGADDLALPGGTRVDKVELVDGRFAVACYGVDIVMHAVAALKGFGTDIELADGSKFGRASSLDEFLARVAVLLPTVARRKHELAEKHTKSSEGKGYYSKTPLGVNSTLIILDCKTTQLFEVPINNIIPPQHAYTLKPKALAADTWHTWPNGLLNNAALEITTARRSLSDAIKEAEERHGPYYGSAGAEVRLSSGNLIYRTCFSSLEDFIKEDASRPNLPGV
ncbi:hypothetical protein [Sorangium sp. So ce1099]|uniref:hypothetical protein n=1 Tax=Sorangium sp. So ce1099 TaxID=3133331 RepID=UPI003F61286E